MPTSPLVSTVWLADHLGDADIRLLEICSTPDLAVYTKGHIPGAQGVYWKTACWHETDREFISPAAMAKQLGALGIGPGHTLVLYGDPVQYGTYAYWAFTMAGHPTIKVVDGSRKRWLAEGRAMTTDTVERAPLAYPVPTGDSSMRVGRRDVRDKLKAPGRILLDVRSDEEFTGKRVIEYSSAFDHGAERFGRIPGAVNMYFRQIANDDDTYKSAADIAAALARAGIPAGTKDEIVVYCRLSHRATFVWFAMTHILGMTNVKIYDGSWTEWGSIVGYPIEK